MDEFDRNATVAAQRARQGFRAVDRAVLAPSAAEAHREPFSCVLRVGGNGVAHQVLHRLQKRGNCISMDGEETDNRLIASREPSQIPTQNGLGNARQSNTNPPPSGPKSDGRPCL